MSYNNSEVSDSEFQSFQHFFNVPTMKSMGISENNAQVTYFCGNSLGLMPTAVKDAINFELNTWANRAVEGHFDHERTPWMDIDLPIVPKLASLVGAEESEVALLGSLTANLNALLTSFYKPVGPRIKILFEKSAFPSDYYAFLNQAKLHGLDPDTVLVQISPRKGEYTIRNTDIVKKIEELKDELALVCFSGVQYYTGQLFDIEAITNVAHKYDITVGWDLAHAVGNVPLELHKWNVDFACWCSYKYLNAGPGAMGGIFVHKTQSTVDRPRLAGWWGNKREVRFEMKEEFEPIPGALGFRQSNPSVIDVVSVGVALDIFQMAGGIKTLRQKSIKMTQFMWNSLVKSKYYIDSDKFGGFMGLCFTIITPSEAFQRGCQLSLMFSPHSDDPKLNTMDQVFKYLRSNGVIVDERKPDVIRFAPVPLYNTFEQIVSVVQTLEKAFDELNV